MDGQEPNEGTEFLSGYELRDYNLRYNDLSTQILAAGITD